MTIALEVLARIRGSLSQSGDGGVATLPVMEVASTDFTDGSDADQATDVYIDEFSIAASGTLDIDLAGSLTDRLGNALVFTAVKAILLIADAANTNDVVFGNDAAPFVGPFDDGTATIAVKPGGIFLISNPTAAGWAVTPGSADVIQLANSAGGSTVAGTIVVIGEA